MTDETDVPGRRARLLLWGCLVLVVAFRFAEPFLDGDLFWHMAYARQMLQHGTLILDHTAFSWTPASNAMIYCAWASELWLYWLFEHLGPWSLHALRYAVVLGAVALAAGYARTAGLGRAVFVPASLVLFALMVHTGTIVKPELFSFLFLNLVVWIYFRAKLTRAAGGGPAALFLLVPAVVALWVNHHGGVLLVAPFLLATAAGELWNALASRALALSKRSLAFLLGGWALCGLAVTLTPYGIRYPVQLFQDYVLGKTPRPDAAWNAAHQTVFARATLSLHLAEFLVILGGALVGLLVHRARKGPAGARVDWAIVILNVSYLALYVPQLRTTYAWPVVGTYSLFYLLSLVSSPGLSRARTAVPVVPAVPASSPVPRAPALKGEAALASVAIGLALFLSGRAAYEAYTRPLDRSWLGFGISDGNPVAEAEFLAAAPLGPRLYNIFDSGGYLLWRLGPAYKVMTDSRSFPYLSWFYDQRRFTNGEIFDEFLRKYPAETAVIDLARDAALRNFLNAPEWTLVYYGPSAAVFTKSGATIPPSARLVAPDRFKNLRNPATATRVFDFATLAGDFPTAWEVLQQLETRHPGNLEPGVLRAALAYRDAHRALRAGDTALARQLFRTGLRRSVVGRRDGEILALLRQLETAASGPGPSAAEITRQLQILAAPE